MTTKTTRIRAAFGLLLAFALLAAACGDDDAAPDTAEPEAPSEPETPAEPEPEAPAEPEPEAPAEPMEEMEEVELRLAIWNEAQAETHEKMIEAFREDFPHISIEVEVIPKDFLPIVRTQIAGGDPPDIIWTNVPNYPDLALNDALLPISDLVERDGVDLSPFPAALIESYTLDGQLYGIPKDYDTIGLYYRTDLFDAAGLDYPDAAWTWDDLKAAAAALTTDDVWGFAAPALIQEFELNLIRQNGGDVLSPDGSQTLFGEPAACEALQFLYSFHTDGTAPDQATQDASHHWGLFGSGRIAMTYDGSWSARGYADSEFDIDVAPLPSGKERSNTIHGLVWAILSDTDHPEEAWEFLKFLATEEAHLIQAETGAVIPAYAGTEQVWLEGFGDEMNVQVLLDEVEYAEPFPTGVAPFTWYWEAARPALQDTFRGNYTFPEACDEIAALSDRHIADNRFA